MWVKSIRVDLQFKGSPHYMTLEFASIFYSSLHLLWKFWKETTSAEEEFQIALQHLYVQQTWALSQNGRCVEG